MEINSQEQLAISSLEKSKDKDSIIIPLNQEGIPLISYNEIDLINNNPDLGEVETKIVFKIPSFLISKFKFIL